MKVIKEKYAQLIAAQNDPKRSSWGGVNSVTGAGLTSDAVNLILAEAISARTSDIHIEPFQDMMRIRFRVDGILYEVLNVPHAHNVNIVARIKVLCNLPTDAIASRKPMDGRFSAKIGKDEFDFRVATFPTLLGEKIAIRVLSKKHGQVNLNGIGMNPEDLSKLERIIGCDNGLLIVCGPTGSGKTTTLYSVLNYLHSPRLNIVTLEDPVEYQIYGINQCDIRKKGDESFASGLKAVLRQDPDVILIGEVRDLETAEIAIRASITGHLVMTSIHANSALGTVVRLVNMGLERYMVSYAVIGAVAQRLVPQLCEKCRSPYSIETSTLRALCEQFDLDLNLFLPAAQTAVREGKMREIGQAYAEAIAASTATFYKKNGCEHCNGTGYAGRVGIFEVVMFSEELRDAIVRGVSLTDLEDIARKKGNRSLAMDAIEKAKLGLVTIDDIYPILLEKG